MVNKKQSDTFLPEVQKLIDDACTKFLAEHKKQSEPKTEPKLIVDKLKHAKDEAEKVKLQMLNASGNVTLHGAINETGVTLSDSRPYRSSHITMTMDEVLVVRDWMTTLLGEDKVVYRDQLIVPMGSDIHIGDPRVCNAIHNCATNLGEAFLAGLVLMGIIWALVHHFC